MEGYRAAGSGLGAPGFLDVEPAALAAVSTLGSGTRVLGVYEQRWLAGPRGPLCVYLHGVATPATSARCCAPRTPSAPRAWRSARAARIPCSPKAVRASMGAIFHVALARAGVGEELPGERVALVPRAGEPLAGPAHGPLTLLVGAEREGLPAEALAACERVAHIPIAGDSLNAAMAATVALYEVTRGWRGWPSDGEPDSSSLPVRVPAS